MKAITIFQYIKENRQAKSLKIKDLAALLAVDSSLISRYENGDRLPTKAQLNLLVAQLDLDFKTAQVFWLKAKIYELFSQEAYIDEAINMVQEEYANYGGFVRDELSSDLKALIKSLDHLKANLNALRHLDSFRIHEALHLEYTFESNKIEGNTLTLNETDLVINEGLTISGKSMREHLEAINHQEAIAFIKDLAKPNYVLKERDLLQIHHLILRGIYPEEAGKYRKVQVMIKGSSHVPPGPYLVAKQMEDLFIWYNTNRNTIHPVVLAAEMHERLVTIHPFIDGNGRTSRLIMNLILMQHGFVIANLKGDYGSRTAYYQALEKCQTTANKDDFIQLIVNTEKNCLDRYLSILKA